MRTRGVWRKVGGRIGGRALKLRGGLAEQRLKKHAVNRVRWHGGLLGGNAGGHAEQMD